MRLCNDKTKRTRPQDTQLGASNIHGKLSRKPKIQESGMLGLRVYLREYTRKTNFEIHLSSKSCCNFLSDSRKDAVGAQ